jgi:glycosyltransferase involved in cell wall biosynthesis
VIRKVLICTTQVPFVSGGAEAHALSLRDALVAAGCDAEIVALPFKWYPPEQIMRGVLAWRLLDLTESNGERVDLVVGMKFPAYAVAHPNKVLWIVHQHRSAYNLAGTEFDDLSTYPEGARVRELIGHCDREFIPEAKKVFANSRTVAARLKEHNGIDSEPLYHPPPRAARLRAGETGDYVFFPSRVEAQKRQRLLVEAMRHTRTPVRAVFAGGGSELESLRALVADADVGSRVELRGFVAEDELIDLYANALAVCYLPFDEDYGYVTLEAMYAARAVVVARDGGGATEFVEDGATGHIVAPDPREIAARLDELYADRALARRLGARGREKIVALNLSWERVAERLLLATR